MLLLMHPIGASNVPAPKHMVVPPSKAGISGRGTTNCADAGAVAARSRQTMALLTAPKPVEPQKGQQASGSGIG
jgi:hypothetical protein